MLNLIPFAGRWRIMGHRYRQVRFVGKILQFLLPETIPDPVGPTPIGSDPAPGAETECQPEELKEIPSFFWATISQGSPQTVPIRAILSTVSYWFGFAHAMYNEHIHGRWERAETPECVWRSFNWLLSALTLIT